MSTSTEDTLATVTAGEAVLASVAVLGREVDGIAVRAEQQRRLPDDVVDLVRRAGLFWLKTPAELGGTELDPVTFARVVEDLAYHDASTAWAVMIGAGTTGLAGGWLSDAGVASVFPTGAALPVLAGQPWPVGRATPVHDGYLVSGRWSFASGIHHADWLMAGAILDDAGRSGRWLVFVAPKQSARVVDNWYVAGLQGTGSCDFALDGVVVPEEHCISDLLSPTARSAARRGGPLFRLSPRLFVANETGPFCLGVTRRAIDDMTALAADTKRFNSNASLAERAAFQKQLGQAVAKLRAARLMMMDAIGRAWDAALRDEAEDPTLQSDAQLAQTYVGEQSAQLVAELIRYGGGRVLQLTHPMQRHLRDLQATLQHIALSEEIYEIVGRQQLQAESTDATERAEPERIADRRDRANG